MPVARKPACQTAWIVTRQYCADCGWPVLICCVNDEFVRYGDAGRHDYWYYCANKWCKNHAGTGVDLEPPRWVAEAK